jgi:dynactin 1
MSRRIQSQFEHLAETLFAGFEHDLGERALGAATGLDGELDMFAAALGLAKTAVEGIMHDEGLTFSTGFTCTTADAGQTSCSTPAAPTLTRTSSRRCRARLGAPRPRRRSRGPPAAAGAGRGADNGYRKLSKRLEELVADSSALRPHVLPRLHGIAERVPELTDFAISVCSTPLSSDGKVADIHRTAQFAQQVVSHVADARSGKASFQLRKVLSLVQQAAGSTVAKGRSDAPPPWTAVADAVDAVSREINAFLPLALEAENVVKGACLLPNTPARADARQLPARRHGSRGSRR